MQELSAGTLDERSQMRDLVRPAADIKYCPATEIGCRRGLARAAERAGKPRLDRIELGAQRRQFRFSLRPDPLVADPAGDSFFQSLLRPLAAARLAVKLL